jgi:rhodanese-related sulfurtransferase
MMGKLLEFGSKHLGLVSIAVAILCAIGVLECLRWMIGSKAISPTRVALLINRSRAKLLDLREEVDFSKGHLPNAIHMDRLSWEGLLKQLTPKQPIILITAQAMPSLKLLQQLRAAGFSELYHLEGGTAAWQQAHLPMVKSSSEL